MAPRQRFIWPTIWDDPDLGRLDAGARLLYIACFSMADDEGRILANPYHLRSIAFLYRTEVTVDDVKEMRDQLEEACPSFHVYEHRGTEYIEFLNWREFQSPKYPKPSKHPPPKHVKRKGKPEPVAHGTVIETGTGRRWVKRGYISQQARQRIYERDGYRCVICNSTENLTIDHKIPVNSGGNNEDSNLQTTCSSCNSRKRDHLPNDHIDPNAFLQNGETVSANQRNAISMGGVGQGRVGLGLKAVTATTDVAALNGAANGLPFAQELLVTKLLAHIGTHADEHTPRVIRKYALHLPEATLAKVLESSEHAKPKDRAAYVVAALKDEREALG